MPGPPTYSSPTVPTGTGAPEASRTRTLTLSAGRPMGIGPEPVSGVRGPTVWVVHSTVVSVGP